VGLVFLAPHPPELKAARAELVDLAALFRGTTLAAEALDSNTLASKLGAASIIHFALHGRYDAASPMRSAMVTGPERPPLLASELAHWRLTRRPWVTLAACESAALRDVPGDAALGLPYAFKLAGAAGVLATLWPVDDAATAEWMRVYYRHVASGMPPPAALTRAQQHFASGGAGEAWRAPFYWAAFVLYL
jgi:CHAT domain-containing protein